jgi:Ca2+-binding RTX toxin-like protein
MPSFFLTAPSQTARILGPSETGFITDVATLYTTADAAVTMDGSARLSVFGTMATERVEALSIANTVFDAFVTVGAEGTILSILDAAIRGELADQFHLNNAGLIQGLAEAIAMTAVTATGVVADFHVVNTGRIQSNGGSAADNTIEIVQYLGAVVDIANSGQIVNGGVGGGIVVTLGRLDLTNSGIIQVRSSSIAISTDLGSDSIVNTGTVIGTVLLGDGNDGFTNHGTVTGSMSLSNGSDTVFNFGTISGQVSLADVQTTGSINDTVVNSGLIRGDVILGNGDDLYQSAGGQVTGTIFGGNGNDEYHVDRSDLSLSDSGGFDQVYTTVDYALTIGFEELRVLGSQGVRGMGSIGNNTIVGGTGDDTLLGGEGDDSLIGAAGDDRLFGGLGNDTILSYGDEDFVRGGAGNDLVQIVFGDATVDGGQGIDTLTLEFVGPAPMAVDLTAGTAANEALGSWTLSRFENVIGGAGDDTLTGTAGANVLQGGDGSDSLVGGNGNDTLAGDLGSDTLAGGGGDDVFIYRSLVDSAAGISDLLLGFSRTRDDIDLSAIEAAAGDPGSAFVFLGTGAFTGGAAGEVRFFTDALADLTTVEVRRAGSTTNDMVILLQGSINLTADSFVL